MHFIDKVVDVPVVIQCQVPVIQNQQKTVEVPQVQYIDGVVDVPVVMQRQVPTIQTVQSSARSRLDSAYEFIGQGGSWVCGPIRRSCRYLSIHTWQTPAIRVVDSPLLIS